VTRVVLASRSPRRTELLRMLGVPHHVEPAHADESPLPGESAREQVRRLARLKASAVAGRSGDALVIGSDTLVTLDGRILGQPTDASEARAMLATLSGRTHTVFTGVCLLRPGYEPAEGFSETKVTFHELSEEEIADYVSTGEPMDKAGAYAAQGVGAVYIRSVEGSFHNVVGFPVDLFEHLLPKVGLSLGELRRG